MPWYAKLVKSVPANNLLVGKDYRVESYGDTTTAIYAHLGPKPVWYIKKDVARQCFEKPYYMTHDQIVDDIIKKTAIGPSGDLIESHPAGI